MPYHFPNQERQEHQETPEGGTPCHPLSVRAVRAPN